MACLEIDEDETDEDEINDSNAVDKFLEEVGTRRSVSDFIDFINENSLKFNGDYENSFGDEYASFSDGVIQMYRAGWRWYNYDDDGDVESAEGPTFTEYFKGNQLHCEDGPAVVGKNSGEIWAINGNLHREDGPAVVGSADFADWDLSEANERAFGSFADYSGKPSPEPYFLEGGEGWYQNGKLHREDGPAIKWLEDGESWESWFINGENITDKVYEWMKENDISYPFSDKYLVLFKQKFC